MAAIASPLPAVFVAGVTQDQPWQPFTNCGAGNPALYHTWFDDFDEKINFTTGNAYTVSGASATFTQSTTLEGGVGVVATEAVANQIAEIQVVQASFLQNIAPKKLFFEARIPALANIANGAFEIGLCNTGAAITAASGADAVTDGIYFRYVGATGVLTINQATGSTRQSATIPATSYSVAASFDLAFYQDRNGDILAFVDTSLVGYITQGQLNTTGNPIGAGPTARILGSSYTASAVLLTPTVCVWGSNGTITSASVDFLTASRER